MYGQHAPGEVVHVIIINFSDQGFHFNFYKFKGFCLFVCLFQKDYFPPPPSSSGNIVAAVRLHFQEISCLEEIKIA